MKTLAEKIQEAKSTMENGQFDEALRLFTAICDSDPDSSQAWCGRGNVLGHLDRYKEAAESFQKAVELDSGSSDLWVGLGTALFFEEPQRAIEPLEHAVKLAPDNANAWGLLGWSFNSAGEFPRAVAAFDRAFTLNPEFSKDSGILLRRAEALNESGRHREAIPLLDLGLELVANAKQESAEQKETEQDRQGQLLLQKGLALNALGRFDEGVVALQQSADLLRADPEKSLALMNESFALTGLKQPPEALAVLEKAAAIAPQNWIAGRISLEQGAILNNLSKYAEAEAPLNRALEFLPSEGPLAPLRAQAWFHKGIALNSLSRFGEAEAALDRALEFLPSEGPLAPMRASAWFHKGIALNSLSRFSEAIDAFDKMSEAGTELPADIVAMACFHKGTAQNRLGRHQEALATFAMAETQLLQGPLAPVVCFQKAIALNALGQSEAAITALTAASETANQPGAIQIPVATLLYQKTLALTNLGKAAEAVTALDEATKADPALLEDLQMWTTRAVLCFQIGRLDDVIAEPSKRLADHPLVLALQGNAFVALGKLAEATAAWQKASSPEGTPRSDEADAWLGFGMCRSCLQEAGEGLNALDRAVKLNPGLEQAPNTRMLRATCLTVLGRHEEALEAAKGAPDIEPVWMVRGMALAALDRTEEALEAFEQGIRLAKKSPIEAMANIYVAAISLQKGLLLLRMERTSLALEAFERGIESGLKVSKADPNYIMSVLGKGWTLERLGRPEEAEEFLIQASQLSKALFDSFPNRSVAWWALGEFLMRGEREEEAVQAFNHALEMEPKNADSLRGRGRAFLALEDFERAEADFSQAKNFADNEQDMLDALVGWGQSLTRLNRNEEAVDTYRRAVTFHSKDLRRKWSVWLGLGEAYQELGRKQAALRAFQQGWRQDKRKKKSSDLAVGIGAMLLETKRDEEALTFLQEAKQKAESDGRVDFNLGLAYYRRQQPEKAREAWADGAKKKIMQAEVGLREMQGKQGATGGWIECWFGPERTKSRKFIGALLVFLLALTCTFPLLKEDTLLWFNTGQDWTVTVTAVVVLAVLFLLPAIKRLSLRKDSLEIEMEPERPETSPLGPSSDSLLRRLTVIGLSMQQGPSFSPGQLSGHLQSQATEADLLKQVPIPGAGTLPAK